VEASYLYLLALESLFAYASKDSIIINYGYTYVQGKTGFLCY
jgi:hypothetical protein